MLTSDELERYARHVILNEVGEAGQARRLNLPNKKSRTSRGERPIKTARHAGDRDHDRDAVGRARGEGHVRVQNELARVVLAAGAVVVDEGVEQGRGRAVARPHRAGQADRRR